MVSLNDAEKLIELFSSCAIELTPSRCVCVRNRHASCTACVDACPASALEVADNRIVHHPELCLQCGSCSNVCPTRAIHSLAAPLKPFAKTIEHHQQHNRAPLWICCQEHPLAKQDLSNLVVLPCLAHLDEVHYCLAAYYQVPLHLLHNDCALCSRSKASVVMEQTRSCFIELAQQGNMSFSIEEHTETSAEESSYPLLSDSGGYSRRMFFTSMAASLKDIGISAAASALDPANDQINQSPTLAEQLSVAPGVLETCLPERNAVLLTVLFEVLQNNTHDAPHWLTSRFWGTVSIDESCQDCGMCATFCPTGALVHKSPTIPNTSLFMPLGKPDQKKGPNHEFRCSDCVQCHLCEDICPAQAIHVSSRVLTKDLFSLEPVKLKRHDSDTDFESKTNRTARAIPPTDTMS